MKLILILLGVLLTACSTPIATTYVEPFIEDDQLAGTIVAGAGWTLDNGVIEPLPTEDRTYLKTDSVFSNFVLTFEFFPVGKVNSGVYIRCQQGQEINPSNCYEINIWDESTNPDSRTGAIVARAAPLEKISSVGKWNSGEVIADSSSITVRMNGVVTAVHDTTELPSGFIALQRANADTVRFRNVRLESLD